MGGLSLSRETAGTIRTYAREHGTSEHSVIVGVLDRWAKRQKRRPGRITLG